MIRLILALMAFVAVAAQPARAECTAGSGERGVALLIGISDYRGDGAAAAPASERWSPLPNAARDIDLVCGSLAQAGYDLMVLRNPDWSTLDSAIADFHVAASQAPSALVYFAGHGFQFDGTQYLVPADAPVMSAPGSMPSHFMPINRLLAAAAAADEFSLFLMDACRTSLPQVQVTEEAGDGDSATAAQTIGLFDVPGGAVIFSTAAGRPAYDDAPVGSPESPFAAAVARNLAVPGLRLMDFYTNLHLDVVEMTEGMQPSGPQHPALYSTRPANFYLVETLDEAALLGAQTAGEAPILAFPSMDKIAVTDGRALVGQILGDIPLGDILAAARGGDGTAQYVAGLAYQHGVGVDENAEVAVDWFERSAAQDNPAGATSLAYMLTFEQFEDRPRALALFRAAADRGYAKAKSQLGYFLITGELGEQDHREAVTLFREASAAGHVFATYALGEYGDGERENAQDRLAELAAAGDPEGDNWLCEMRYVEQSYDRMAEPCERAALAGYSAPRAIFAGMLARGDGVERDRDQARYWARLALTQLDPVRRAALHEYTSRLVR